MQNDRRNFFHHFSLRKMIKKNFYQFSFCKIIIGCFKFILFPQNYQRPNFISTKLKLKIKMTLNRPILPKMQNSHLNFRARNMYMTSNDKGSSCARPVMAQKMLQQSREAESALADALTSDTNDHYPRTPRCKGDHSDDSETSSICSERSMDSFRRPSDVSSKYQSLNLT